MNIETAIFESHRSKSVYINKHLSFSALVNSFSWSTTHMQQKPCHFFPIRHINFTSLSKSKYLFTYYFYAISPCQRVPRNSSFFAMENEGLADFNIIEKKHDYQHVYCHIQSLIYSIVRGGFIRPIRKSHQILYKITQFGLKLSKNCQISEKSHIRFGRNAL